MSEMFLAAIKLIHTPEHIQAAVKAVLRGTRSSRT